MWIRRELQRFPLWWRRDTQCTSSPGRLVELWRLEPVLCSALLEAHQPKVPARINWLCRSIWKALAKVWSFLHCPTRHTPSATKSHFEVLLPIFLGLALPSQENRRSYSSLGKSSQWGLWIHTYNCSFGTKAFPLLLESSAASEVVSLECPFPSLRLQRIWLLGQHQSCWVLSSIEKQAENCQGQPGSLYVDCLESREHNLVLLKCFYPLHLLLRLMFLSSHLWREPVQWCFCLCVFLVSRLRK